jgi:hypothetical protein
MKLINQKIISDILRLLTTIGNITANDEAMSSCLLNTAQLTTNADRQLLIAFVIKRFYHGTI